MLDLCDRLVVIVGGGSVAARKAAGVLAAGAERVRAVAPVFAAGFPAGVERIEEPFREEHLEGAGLVFAATDSGEVNEAVVLAARRRGLWVNRADGLGVETPGDEGTGERGEGSGSKVAGSGGASLNPQPRTVNPELGDFVVPAVLRRGEVTVAVATGGSPALAAVIRDEMDRRFEPAWERMAEALQVLRREIVQSGMEGRREILRKMVTAEGFAVLEKEGVEGLRRFVEEGGSCP
jgi:precorrin-2 dehydrogenase / sirohydrochlorin ferrochelatase